MAGRAAILIAMYDLIAAVVAFLTFSSTVRWFSALIGTKLSQSYVSCITSHVLFPWGQHGAPTPHGMCCETIHRPPAAGLVVLGHFGCSLLIIVGNRSTAQKKLFVQNDLEYSTLSSVLLVCSVQQVVASLYLICFVATGFNWSKSSHAVGGVVYLVGLCASFTAGAIGIKLTSLHLLSDENLLVRFFCSILDIGRCF